MLEILIDEENTTYLEALAQKLNIDKEELRKKAETLANELGGRQNEKYSEYSIL